jgi:hypothetical protein
MMVMMLTLRLRRDADRPHQRASVLDVADQIRCLCEGGDFVGEGPALKPAAFDLDPTDDLRGMERRTRPAVRP